jgi:hypothetical protein
MNVQLQRPTRVTRAWERLDRAVNRLDAALAAQVNRTEAGQAELRHALDDARAQNAALKDAAIKVSERLDAVVTRLKDALED